MFGKEVIKKGLDYMKKPVIKREYIRTSLYSKFEDLYQGKIVLVTGGTRGIGLATARMFLSAGAEVIITGRTKSGLDDAARVLNSDRLHTLKWDITDIAGQEEKMNQVFNIFGGVDVLVNNAGANRLPSGESARHWDEVSEAEWNFILDTNLKAMYFMIQGFSRKWLEEKIVIDKHIVNISSSSGFEPAVLPYGISKWGVVAVTQGFGRKLAPHGIIVNGVAPGPTATVMAGKVDSTDDLGYPSIPKQRYGVAEEIANMVVLLASDFGKNIVGEVIKIDGGFSLTMLGGQ